MARAAHLVVTAGQDGPMMRQRVIVAYEAHRVRIGLALHVWLIICIIIVVGIGVGGGDLGRGELGRRVGGFLPAALPAVADHRGAGGTAAAVPAAIAPTPAGGAASTTAAGHAGKVSYAMLAGSIR